MKWRSIKTHEIAKTLSRGLSRPIVVENRPNEISGEVIAPWGWHDLFYGVSVEA